MPLIYFTGIEDLYIAALDHVFEDDFGNRLTVFVDEVGEEVPYEWVVTYWEVGTNILITTDVTFNIYRDEILIANNVNEREYIDLDVMAGIEYCYMVMLIQAILLNQHYLLH